MKNLPLKTEKILSLFDKNRLLILANLYQCQGDVCACNLVDRINIPKNLISHHIRILRELGIIEEKRCGRNKNYQIKKSVVAKVKQILEILELI